ncbi:MAG: hypothetical protein EAX81_03955 [Candidatus Thorarchaeota archaeon]|nr:hypothetical protein [Candidatus Thorarchaeota archaeon]
MVVIHGDNEIHPDPLGDLMLDLIWDKMSEEPHIDFKLTIDISQQSDFAKLAKHIFAMANKGSGWILFGFLDKKKKIIPVGLDERIQIDQAQLQEKFNSFSSEKIELGFRLFERHVEEKGVILAKQFAVVYVPPSTSVLKPIKDGIYIKDGKRKYAFRRNDVLTRRGTQSIVANDKEHREIEKRIKLDQHRMSLLTGRPDQVEEVIFGNLLKVLEIPKTVYTVRIETDDFPLSRTGDKPFTKQGRRLHSFCRFDEHKLQDYIVPDSQEKIDTEILVQSDDGRNLITHLLNIEATAAMKKKRMVLDSESRPRALFYTCKDEVCYEGWGDGSSRKPRKVVRKFYVSQVTSYRWRHWSVSLQFQWINNQYYLKVEPSIVLTNDGVTPVHNLIDGTAITRLLRLRYNSSYHNDLKFWRSKLPKDEFGHIVFGQVITEDENGEILTENRITISSEFIRAYMDIGIDGDTPAKEQKEGPLAFDRESVGTEFKSQFIEEPKLLFGGQREEEDPRIGLKYFGPYHAKDEEPIGQVRLGIIGTGSGREVAKNIIDLLGQEIACPSENKFLFPSYPGFNTDSPVNCQFKYSNSWNETITQSEVDRIISIQSVHERIHAAVELYHDKVKSIAIEDNRPDVILCIVPDAIDDYCGISKKTRWAKRPRYTKEEKDFAKAKEEGQTTLVDFDFAEPDLRSFDLHDAIKGAVMDYGIPVQLLIERNGRAILDYPRRADLVQNPATFSWNFSTAMYYKANGKPWRLAKLEQDTCYVGIAFYSRRDDPLGNLKASMAQVFTHSGDGFVLQGAKVEVDKKSKEVHLQKDSAFDLLNRAIETYTLKSRTKPARVVIHKLSRFNSDERQGFLNAIGRASADFISIGRVHGFRFVRTGKYPVLRGTMIKINEKQCLLYTSGYIPRLRTYPGPRVPRPLLLDLDCDSEMDFVASEILKLTKINWNTSSFGDKLPITIIFPEKVGAVLSEIPEGKEVQGHYRFYM